MGCRFRLTLYIRPGIYDTVWFNSDLSSGKDAENVDEEGKQQDVNW